MRKPYLVTSALLLSISSMLVLSSIPASAQARTSIASSNGPSSCTSTVIKVHSDNQGDVFPAGVNKSDTVVGLFQDLTTLQDSGFQWSGSTGQLYNYPGASQAWLSGINDAGLMLGAYTNSQGQGFGFYMKNDRQNHSRWRDRMTPFPPE